MEQLKEQERAVDQAEKVQREVVERALEDKFLYLKNSEKEVEGTYVNAFMCVYLMPGYVYTCMFSHCVEFVPLCTFIYTTPLVHFPS